MQKTEFIPNKKEVLVTRRKGPFIRKCPGTKKYACCDYYVLSLGIGCNFNCTYCFLHHYMNTLPTAYNNTDDLLQEVEEFCKARPDKIIRLGSGEFIDSLGFDELTNQNAILVPTLSQIANLIFEVKTKSNKVEHLLGLKHSGRVVVSFSVNSEEVAASEESDACSIVKRIKAAVKCQLAGYKIGFHFDPLIYYKGWQEGYKRTVDDIFSVIVPKNIAWISLGALRFNPTLKPIIQCKFPNSKIIYAEMVPGLDGKLRYFIAIRKKLFKTLMGYIRSYSKEVPVYLCMESKELAQEVDAIPSFTLN